MNLKELSELTGYSEGSISHHFDRTKIKLKEKGMLISKEKIGNKNNYSIEYIEPEFENSVYEIGKPYGPYDIILLKKAAYNKEHNNYLYEFQCPYCSNTFLNTITRVKTGNTRSCGCLSKKNHVGEKYENFEVIEQLSERAKDGHIQYKCKCKCGNEFITLSNRLRTISSCGCLQSKGEALLAKIFTDNNIIFEKQKQYNNCTYNGNKMRFDFYLPEYNCLIEYDGSLHFEYSNNGWNTKEKYEETVARDNYKNEWCKNNNIPLIRFSYLEKDNIDIDYILNKVKEVIIKNGCNVY